MNRTLLTSLHGLAAAAVVGVCMALALSGQVVVGRAPQGERAYLLWTGWIALLLFVLAYAYVLRKYAHKLGYSPEFGWQVPKGAMESAQQQLGVLRERIATKALTDKGQILAAARQILRDTGCARVLRVQIAQDAGGLPLLQVARTEPLARAARWLHAHVYYGLGACLLAFLHGGAGFQTPMGVILNGLTTLVLVSGVVGLLFWLAGPGWLTKAERDLSIEEAFVLDRHYQRRLAAEQAQLHSVDPQLAQQFVAAGASTAEFVQRLATACGGGQEGERRARDLLALLGQRRKVAAELQRLERVRWLMNAWRPIHIPASIALLAAIVVHVMSIWLY